jgi:hypothetical protein
MEASRARMMDFLQEAPDSGRESQGMESFGDRVHDGSFAEVLTSVCTFIRYKANCNGR